MITDLDRSEHHDYGLKTGHAPIADKVVCVDFDSTLFPWGPLFNWESDPEPGAADALKAFREAGWHIVIFTSRMSRQWLANAGENREEQYAYIATLMSRHGIPWDRILAEKIPAQAYVDDKAIEYTGDNWGAVQERVLARGR